MPGTVKVEYILECSFANARLQETVEFDREVWGSMTESQREESVKDHALGDNVSWNWWEVS